MEKKFIIEKVQTDEFWQQADVLELEEVRIALRDLIKLIVDYIVANGMIEDNRIFMEEPFRSLGSITSLFKDNIKDARELMNVISIINKNTNWLYNIWLEA